MNRDLKYQIMKEIEHNVHPFEKKSPIQYRMRCPFCGDSDKDSKDMHLYLKCDYDNPNEPILYNCFLANCGAHGRVNKYFMKLLGINSKFSKQLENERYNRIPSIKEANIDIVIGTPILDSPQVRYIKERLGKGFNMEDYDVFKIVWDIDNIKKYIGDRRILNTLPSNRNTISFMSDNKSTMVTRGFLENDKWKKTTIYNADNTSYYTIKNVFNLFTDEIITVNIAEGIFDILSVYKNFNTGINSAYIALLGPDYESGIEYAIMKGLIGSNVDIRIYVDRNIKIDKLKPKLKKYKFLFNSIKLYKNIAYKDMGTTIDKISLQEYQV